MVEDQDDEGFVSAAEAVSDALQQAASVWLQESSPASAPKQRSDLFEDWPHPVSTDDHGYDDVEAYADDGLNDDGVDDDVA